MRSPENEGRIIKDLSPKTIDIRECEWWKPISFGLVNDPKDSAQEKLSSALTESLTVQGHIFIENPQFETERLPLMLAFDEIPGGIEPLRERIGERKTPLGLALMSEFGLQKRPDNLVTAVTISESLSNKTHPEVSSLARLVMARRGTPRVLFITDEKQTGEIDEVTLCTLEGGHPTISGRNFDFLVRSLRDRLVTLARTEQVGDKFRVKENALSQKKFQASPIPDQLILAGARMNTLGLLPEPISLDNIVSSRLARMYERFLDMSRFSEGMLCAWDPKLNYMMVTGSGSWGVDKRHLERDQVLAISGIDQDDYLIVEGVEGLKQPGPSVEGFELFACFNQAPRVKLRLEDNRWRPDPSGNVEAPIIRAIFHAHVGIKSVDENLVELVPSNRHDFPYPFCCGSDLNLEVSTDAVGRSSAINNPDDPRSVVVWRLENHGIVAAELQEGSALEKRALQHALDMFDPEAIGAVHYTPDHITQI